MSEELDVTSSMRSRGSARSVDNQRQNERGVAKGASKTLSSEDDDASGYGLHIYNLSG